MFQLCIYVVILVPCTFCILLLERTFVQAQAPQQRSSQVPGPSLSQQERLTQGHGGASAPRAQLAGHQPHLVLSRLAYKAGGASPLGVTLLVGKQ